MSEDIRVYVRSIARRVSMTAALDDGSSFWVHEPGDPLVFDFDRTYVRKCGRREEPTIFRSEAEAEAKVEALIAQVNAVLRYSGAGVDVGLAASLRPQSPGQKSYMIESYGVRLAAQEMDRQFRERRQAEEQAVADERVRAAQEEADAIRAKGGVVRDTAGRGDWSAHPTAPSIQQRENKAGVTFYRARKAGKTSPSFQTLAAAVAWRDGEPMPKPELNPAIAEKLLADSR